ncbi:MAG: hypothetical protein JF887_00765 [Candidatus Dormibacteraeota bacterium]|uniref:Uncharacterized protein n=1 Tax=Candidatus Amunia macphersoniae TaxID=3127014 RepID=A0A934KFY2_9BACT|nr:hypothetical protein [Candidatus Dormibacteraeota bacterium]
MDWVLISSLATAAGTLVLGAATFASVRSANRAARAAEGSLLAGLRPLLVPSRFQDPPVKISFADQHWVKIDGGHAVAEVTDEAIYLAISLRNVGSGIGVLHGWIFHTELRTGEAATPRPEDFRRLTRDIYVPAGDNGFWMGAFREPSAEEFVEAHRTITARQGFTIDLLYGDFEGGQRSISRFSLLPAREQEWLASVGRHWNIDRPSPR